MVPVIIETQSLEMELDTGTDVSLISEETYRQLFKHIPLQESRTSLRSYSGDLIDVKGRMDVNVSYGDQHKQLPLLVVSGKGPSLLGKDWLSEIRLRWKEILRVQEDTLEQVLREHDEVFQDELGTLKGFQAKIYVDPSAQPKFCKARSVPYAMQLLVEEELERLVQLGILEPVQFAEWAAPIVPVLKSDKKSVRICGDFKLTVNQASRLDRYPIPKIKDLLARLSGGKTFTKLDMR